VTRRRIFNPRLAIERARSGDATDAEVRKDIDTAEQFGNSGAVSELRAILQVRSGARAVKRMSAVPRPGSAEWAFAQFGAAAATPYSWSALTVDGDVVVNLWDDKRDFDGTTFQPQPWARQPATKKSGTRTQFFQTLETALASRGGLLRVTLSTAMDRDARPVKRTPGKTRSWLNEDGSPVLIRIVELEMPSPQELGGYWRAELAEAEKRPRSPFLVDES
jgi:hypothetical protein